MPSASTSTFMNLSASMSSLSHSMIWRSAIAAGTASATGTATDVELAAGSTDTALAAVAEPAGARGTAIAAGAAVAADRGLVGEGAAVTDAD